MGGVNRLINWNRKRNAANLSRNTWEGRKHRKRKAKNPIKNTNDHVKWR